MLIVVSVLAQRVLTSEMFDVAPLLCPYTSPNHGEHVVELVHSLISLQFLRDTLLLIAALL